MSACANLSLFIPFETAVQFCNCPRECCSQRLQQESAEQRPNLSRRNRLHEERGKEAQLQRYEGQSRSLRGGGRVGLNTRASQRKDVCLLYVFFNCVNRH